MKTTRFWRCSAPFLFVVACQVAAAQGVGSATIRFQSPLSFGPAYQQWDKSYPWTGYFPEYGGYALSETSHGRTDVHGLEGRRTFRAESFSPADSEVSTNSISYSLLNLFGRNSISLNPSGTMSQSQAAAESADKTHWGYSITTTTVMHKYNFSRLGEDFGDPFKAWTVFRADAGAVKMKTQVEGNADAFAEIQLSFVGKIRNLRSGSEDYIPLRPIVLLHQRIEGNDSFSSPEISGLLALDLPNFTRLSYSNFDLSLGLQTRLITYASAAPVPEPATMAMLGIGVTALVRKRRRRSR